MRPVLRPGDVLLRRDPAHLQLGTVPGRSLVLDDRPGLVGLLRLLDGVRDRSTVECVAREQLPLEHDPALVLDALVASGVVVDAAAWQGEPAPPAPPDPATGPDPEAADGPAERRRRRTRRGSALVQVVADEATHELAGLLRGVLETAGLATTHQTTSDATVVVLLHGGEPVRERLDHLHRRGTTHLPVVVEQGLARIGPWVVPTATPCVGCADRQRAAWDDAWPALLTQLDAPVVPASYGHLTLRTTLAHLVAATVADDVVTGTEDLEPQTTGRILTLGPDLVDRTETEVALDPRCGCRDLPTGPRRRPAGRVPARHVTTAGTQ